MKDELTAEGDAVADAPLEAPSLQPNNINAMSEETQMPRQSHYDHEDDYCSSRSRGSRMRDDDGYGGRGRSQGSGSQSSRGRNEGHGGWFGDSQGHAQAARRGWRDRD